MMKTIALNLALLLFPFMVISQVSPDWTMIFNGNDDYFDNGLDIALDPSGNIFVGGTSVSITNGAPNYVIIKYSPAGEFKWAITYDGDGLYEDNLAAIATDSEGNVYATGGSYGGASRNDFVTLKISGSGVFGWKSIYKGLDVNNDDAATDIVAGNDGYIYVTGASAGVSSSMWTDFATLKLSSNGDTVWTRRLGGSGMPNDRATAIAVDNYGFVYVTGYVEADVSQRYNYATVKYKPGGDTAWVRTYNGTASDEDRALAIAVDGDRNVFITGTSWGTFYDDYATIKYDSNGVQQWVARYNGPANSYDKAWDLKLDNQGNAYVTGQSGGSGGNYDYCTIKYNTAGGEEWVARYNGPENLDDVATSLAVDNQGNVFVTGNSKNAPSPYISTTDMVIIGYNSSGQEEWVHRFDGPGSNDDLGNAIATDQSGNVFVTGTTEYYGGQNSSDIFTVRYSSPSFLPDNENNSFFNIYPNPAREKLYISCTGSSDKLEIYNMLGESCNYSTGKNSLSGQYEVDIRGLASGMYFIILKDEKRTYTQKFVKGY